jgi:curved DNA-binding protein CbpA
MGRLTPTPTAYALLGIHPSAPAELADAAYWRSVIALQKQRAAGGDADSAIHALTSAFATLSDAQRRADYDLTIGYRGEPLISRRTLQLRRSILSRIVRRGSATAPAIDYYEIIGLDECASGEWVPDARRIMRDYYLKAPDDRRRAVLLSLLDEACSVISDVQKRAQYDAKRRREAPHLLQQARADSDSLSASPGQGARDSLGDSMPPDETRSPAGASERPGRPQESPARIAPRVPARQDSRPAGVAVAGGDSAQKQQASARSETNREPDPDTTTGLPPRRTSLVSSVGHLAGGTVTRSGRAVVVLGRVGAAPIRGTTRFAAKALRSRSHRHGGVQAASQAHNGQPKQNVAGSQKDVESILLGRIESSVRSEPSSHPPDEPTD